jgi:Holliday junction resolvase RusA-like endonuclease
VNIELRIYGQTPSKKSSQSIIINKKTGKMMVIPNKKYMEWEKYAKFQLKEQKERLNLETIKEKVWVKCLIYRLTKRQIDLTNLLQSIHDVLEISGIIKDDCLIYSIDGSRKILGVGPGEERAEIFINSFDPF